MEIEHYGGIMIHRIKSTGLNLFPKLIVNILVLTVGMNIYGQDAQLSTKQLAAKVAESVMSRQPEVYSQHWHYILGTVLLGFKQVWEVTGDQKYFDYIKTTIDRLVDENGNIQQYRIDEHNIDQIKTGSVLLFLYQETGQEKYKIASDMIRSQFDEYPRTKEGGFWHKQIYPNQMWLDGLYMGQPFYTQYAKMFNQPEVFDDAVKQFRLIRENLYDQKTGLYYHGWDSSCEIFWADKKTGLSQNFWGRGLGWYVMALVDVLDYLPENHSGRQELISQLQDLAETLTKFQDPETGCWWQVLDQGGREGNYIECSASGMFLYGLAKGVRLGYIDIKYYNTVQKAFKGIQTHLMNKDIRGNYNLFRICRSAGLGGDYLEKYRDGSYEYYVYIENIVSNNGHGTGPFLKGCAEIAKMEFDKQ